MACGTPFHKIKMFFFVYDVDCETGPFSVVPGSHRWIDRDVTQLDDLNAMHGHVRLNRTRRLGHTVERMYLAHGHG